MTYVLLSVFFIAAFIFPFFPDLDYQLIRGIALGLLVSALVWDSVSFRIRNVDKIAQER